MQISPRQGRWIAACLLAALGSTYPVAISRKTLTTDELIHIPAGYYYWTVGSFALNAEHPPLVKLWAALPLLLLTTPTPSSTLSPAAQEGLPFYFEFWVNRVRDFQRLAFWPRVMMIPLALALGALIFAYTRKLFGTAAALFALILYCVEPTFLAHGRIVHTDVPSSLAYLGFFFLLHRYLEKRDVRTAIDLGLATAAALLVKFSMIVLVPVLVLGFCVEIVRASGNERKRALARLMIVGILILLTINAVYFFQHPALSDADRALIALQSRKADRIAALVPSLSLVLPTHFPFGLYLVLAHNEIGHATSMLGMQDWNGWWYYFPMAFVLKTSIPIVLVSIAAFLWSFDLTVRKRSMSHLILIAPIGLYAVMAMRSQINIGIRHFLPVFPFLLILSGGLLSSLVIRWRRTGSVIAAVILSWGLFEAARSFPHYTSYMNQFARGPSWTYLSDSNIEWGDDIQDLAVYLKSRGITRIQGAMLGSQTLAYMGIDYGDLFGEPGPDADYVALGASYLNGSTIPLGLPGSGRETEETRVNYFAAYRAQKAEAVFGGSIFLYRVRR